MKNIVFDTIALGDGMKVLVQLNSWGNGEPGNCHVTVYKTDHAGSQGPWWVIGATTIALEDMAFPDEYNGGHFERYESGSTRILVTPVFALMVTGERCQIQPFATNQARLVLGKGCVWLVGSVYINGRRSGIGMSRLCVVAHMSSVPTTFGQRPCTNAMDIVHEGGWSRMSEANARKRQCFSGSGRDGDELETAYPIMVFKSFQKVWSNFGYLSDICLLDASWDANIDLVVCLVCDERLVGSKIYHVRLNGLILGEQYGRDLQISTVMAASYLKASTSTYVCATFATNWFHARNNDARKNRSVFVCDSRSQDRTFVRDTDWCSRRPFCAETVRFLHTDDRIVHDYVFMQHTGMYAHGSRKYNLTQVHIFDLRTMTVVDTIDSPLPSRSNTHVRMRPRVVSPGSVITIDAIRTSYKVGFAHDNPSRRVPVRSLDGTIWEPLDKDHTRVAPTTIQLQRSVECAVHAPPLVFGTRASERSRSARMRWIDAGL
jgi:hypothetical protein